MARKVRDITGLVVGKLTVKYIYKQSAGSGNHTLWFCECECGGSIVKPLSDLVRTKFSNCGCDKTKPAARKDHTGVRYGKVVGVCATEQVVNSQVVWKWLCDCGTEFESVAGGYVHKNYSPGCADCAKESVAASTRKRATTHGMSKTKEHKSWCHIKERCYNPNNQDYYNYGAKGVTLFDGWKDDFVAFYEHIGEMPKDGKRYTCDRLDNNKGYEPGNVRWATDHQQARNKKLMGNNSSGVTGVSWEDKLHPDKTTSTLYAIAQWHNLPGKACKKSYSVKKYGEELAFFLACEKRELEIMKLNLLGAGYSENHGL